MRRLFTADASGLSRSELRWGEHKGKWRHVACHVYADGPEPPTPLDLARAKLLASSEVARDDIAGLLLGLDSVVFLDRPRRRYLPPPQRLIVVEGIQCGNGIQTMIDLAAMLDDLRWEQAYESARRKGLVCDEEILDALPALGRARIPGTARMRRVLQLRRPGEPPTESLLETMMVQLGREVPEVIWFERQYEVRNENGIFVARLDLSRPDAGAFVELDGQQHKDQPVYDAIRQTDVVTATGWLPGRFTWTEVTRFPNVTKRRLANLFRRARARPA